jgi:flagellar L-ring protein precursor FlgH
MKAFPIRTVSAAALAAAALAASGCSNLDRLAQVGERPPMLRIQNPKAAPGYRKVSMPMPRARVVERQANSLWRPGARAFFKDQRAARVGDIITININVADQAKFSNSTKRARTANDKTSVDALLGWENKVKGFFGKGADPTNLFQAGTNSSTEGTGSIDRDETLKIKVAAVVTQVLPNGNLVIHGRQEVRVNYELRALQVAGVIRREDITSANTIDFDKIAEARVAYGGRGIITDIQQPRLGRQVFDILFPF